MLFDERQQYLEAGTHFTFWPVAPAAIGRMQAGRMEASQQAALSLQLSSPTRWLKASYTSSLRPHTLVAEGLMH